MSARIVSLVPSLTELLCSLGLREQLVGRTGFCVHPRRILADVPKVGGTKSVDIDRVRQLCPTHLIVSREENEQPSVAAIARFVPQIVVTDVRTLADNRALYHQMGDRFGRRSAAERLCEAFDTQLSRLTSRQFGPIPVLYLIWKSPWMTVTRNTFISSMLASAGLHSVPAHDGVTDTARYPVIDDAAFENLRPGLVLLSTEPYRFTAAHRSALTAQMSAAGQARGRAPVRCELIDGELTSWYGSRAIAGLRYLSDFRAAIDAAGPKAHA